jgi:UPF0755 protein
MTSRATINALLLASGAAVGAGVWAAATLVSAPVAPDQTPAPIAALERPEPAPAASPAPVPANIDPAAFGVLPASVAPAATSRVTMMNDAAQMPSTPASLTTTPLQSIVATFAAPLPGAGLPDLGGAAALDGPADAGLDEPVVQADLRQPPVAPPTGKIIAIDASEGTKLDPLRQRNWDLNSVQVVPPMAPARQR